MRPCTGLLVAAAVYVVALPAVVMANTATIEKVYQGDRLQIKGWEIVRLTGIIAPKLDENCGEEACQFTKQELEGKLVVMRTYTTDNTAAGIVRDAEGLCMVQIEYEGDSLSRSEKTKDAPQLVDFNALMLAKGLARVDEMYLPTWLQHYKEIEDVAQEKKIGIWADHTAK